MSSSALLVISQVEKKWLNMLYLYNREIFSGIHLPSHDHTHHLRVWQFARELILIWCEAGRQFSLQEIELLILAVFFHDTGMSHTQHMKHGAVSRKFCEAFLLENSLQKMPHASELLNAVEMHDDKEYADTHRDPTSLLTLLNLADDLDAFGLVGVYRYAEIYLMRGIFCHEIPGKVLPNLDTRYNHLTSLLPMANEEFAIRCKIRFTLTSEFYEAATDDLKKEMTNTPVSSAHLMVLSEIAEQVITKKRNPLQLATEGLSSPATRDWWNSFEQEWNHYKYPET